MIKVDLEWESFWEQVQKEATRPHRIDLKVCALTYYLKQKEGKQ